MRRQTLLLVLVLVLLAACGTQPAAVPTTAPQEAEETEAGTVSPDLRETTVAFAYIPNVQFAPFYVADSKGYYREAGLDVTFDYNYETDTLQRVAQETVDFAHGSGISLMLARQQELPVVMVMTHYQQFPVVFFSKADYPLATPEDLADATIGLPGRFGASYYGLLALLYTSDLQEPDMNIQEIGFTQVEAVLQDNVQVASGYGMNEPVQLREMGQEANVLRVADFFPLVADGIMTNQALIENDPQRVHDFVQATMRGLQDTFDDPEEAFTISLDYIPEAELGDSELQRKVLEASLPYWESEQPGYSDPVAWQETHTFLLNVDLLNDAIEVEEAFTNKFIE